MANTIYSISNFIAKARNNNARFYWLLDMSLDGTTIRIADAPLIIPTNTDATKNTDLYDAGIPRLFYQEGLHVNGTVLTDIDLNIWSRSGRTIKANLQITGHHELQTFDPVFGWANKNAELSLWIDGLVWEDRYIVL